MLDHRLYFAAFLTAASALTCGAHPVVNEILASNQAVLADPEGEFDDWVEIYNPEGTDLDLRGYFFSDDPEEPTKWRIAGEEAVVVPANGYVLLWLDGDTEAGTTHLPFRLNAEGDFFLLTSHDGVTVLEEIALPLQHPDISYGRTAGGGETFRYLINPTPGVANDPLGVDVLEGVTFSEEAGTFVDPFELSLATTST